MRSSMLPPRSIPTSAALALLLTAALPAHAATPATLTVDLGGGEAVALVLVPKGTFTQGSPVTEKGRKDDEIAHPVTLTSDFYLGKYLVTYGQFARFTAATGYRTEAEKGASGGSGFDGKDLVQRKEFTWKNPGFPQTTAHPVTLVTWDDARAFTAWLTRLSGRSFDLPTEAQWEYAYRAGTTTPYYGADSEQGALALGWFKENAGGGTHPVGQKKANGFGLFDMSGDVFQWCRDWYAPYGPNLAVDPEALSPDASDKPRRVLRGGSWFKEAKNGRAAARYRNTPGSRNADNGFRVVAGTSVTTAAPALPAPNAPGPGTPDTKTAPGSSPGRSDTASKGLFAVAIGGGCMGTLAIVGVMIWLIRRASGGSGGSPTAGQLSFRLGADGFWIHAPPHLRGSTLRYRYRVSPSSFQEGWVALEPSSAGQFVYTGYRPLGIDVRDVVAPARPVQVSTAPAVVPNRGYSSVQPSTRRSDPPPFGGYPSAY